MTERNLPTLKALKVTLKNQAIIDRFVSTLGKEEAGTFMTSIINIVASNSMLQGCTEESIMTSAFKSASLKLPIEPSLGRAYIIPYGKVAQFQLGYKGLRELAIRSGLYSKIRAVPIYEDELKSFNPITGEVCFNDPESYKCRYDAKKEPIGYYAFFEMNTGFEANVYMTKKEVENHAKKYSKAYSGKESPWQKEFDKMACKTVLKKLLNEHGILSIEMRGAIVGDDTIEVQSAEDGDDGTKPKRKEAPKPGDSDVIENQSDDPETQENDNEPDPFE